MNTRLRPAAYRLHQFFQCRILLTCIVLFPVLQRSYAEVHDTIRIAAYNLLDYPSNSNPVSDTTLRNPYFRTIVQAMNPDILVVEEINSLNGLDGFLLNVLNADSSNFSKGDFHDGPDTDNGIFFKTSAFRFISNRVIPTDLRDINEFTLIHLLSGDTLRIYAVHLKASSGSSNEAQRALEVDSLRKITNALPAGSNFMVMGDFNIYQSGEAAYEKLLDTTSGNEGYFIDPVVMPGVWNNISYSVHHTQSTRTRSFGNGVTGGMDDRFDLLMFSNAVSQPGGIEYVPGSQIAFGNDGNHYNDSINQQPNTAVLPQVANALHYASDHLPIIAGFTVAYSPGNNPTDVGVTTLITPADSICPEAAHPVVVAIKNFAQTTLDFTSTPVDITVRVTRPDAGLQTFSITLNSGSLSAGAQQICTVSTSCDMSMSGTYTFTAWASSGTDTNHGNDTLPPVPVTVRSVPQASINPPGPLNICAGTVLTLTASTGTGYTWSDGSTTQSILVSTAGGYSVLIHHGTGCSSASLSVMVSMVNPGTSGTVFLETMGSSPSTTQVPAYENTNGFDNDDLTMSGSGDVRNTAASSGYLNASGLGNVFLTTINGRNFIISGINVANRSQLTLSFGIYKNTNSSDGSDLKVQVSSDGISYTDLAFSPLPVTSSGWFYRTASGYIPAVPSLYIQFRQTGTTTQFRIDDVQLSGSLPSSHISPQDSVSLCPGDSALLTASSGASYLWNTGAVSQSIYVSQPGIYFVSVDCIPSDTAQVVAVNCSAVVLSLRVFIEGFYQGNGTMSAVADPAGNPGIADTIEVELADTTPSHDIQFTSKNVLLVNGTGQFQFPPAALNHNWYLVIRHRNSLETWSAGWVSFNNPVVNYDFSTAPGKAYGSNMRNIGSVYCLFSGDVTDGVTPGNQDGFIESGDYSELENAGQLFQFGYLTDDLTGDNIVESADYSLLENNGQQFIFTLRP